MAEKEYPLPPKLDHRASTMDPFDAIMRWLLDEVDEEFIDLGGLDGCQIIKLFERTRRDPKLKYLKDRFARVLEKAMKPGHVGWAFEELLRREKEKRI